MFFDTCDALLLATGNRHKFEEFKALLPCAVATKLLFAPDVVPLDVEETGSTYVMNALLKAQAWSLASGLPSLADDSGLEVEALGFGPGVRSARAAVGGDGDRNHWILSQMEGLQNRRAWFVAALALSVPNSWTLVCEGDCQGTLGVRPLGEHGFGYDPLFVPDGCSLSFAQMKPEVKNTISHRAAALRLMLDLLEAK